MAVNGKLSLTFVEAKLTHDTEWFGKMSPFCRVKVREQTFVTKVCSGGGKSPHWNETYEIDVKYLGDDLMLEIDDKDMMSTDMIGTAVIKLSSLCCNEGVDDWFLIQYKGRNAGKIHLRSRF